MKSSLCVAVHYVTYVICTSSSIHDYLHNLYTHRLWSLWATTSITSQIIWSCFGALTMKYGCKARQPQPIAMVMNHTGPSLSGSSVLATMATVLALHRLLHTVWLKRMCCVRLAPRSPLGLKCWRMRFRRRMHLCGTELFFYSTMFLSFSWIPVMQPCFQ